MRALCWQGKKDIRCESVPDPIIEHDTDAIVQVDLCAICGSDLHLMDGFVPGMCKGDVMGHEMMGHVVETGRKANGACGSRLNRTAIMPPSSTRQPATAIVTCLTARGRSRTRAPALSPRVRTAPRRWLTAPAFAGRTPAGPGCAPRGW